MINVLHCEVPKKVSYASIALKSTVYFAIQEINNEAENKMAIQPECEAKLNCRQAKS